MRLLQSLTFKLILAFLVVSLAGAVLSVLLARWATGRAFDNLVMDQARAQFVGDAASYYELMGSWDGVARGLPQRRPAVGRQPARGGARVRAARAGSLADGPGVRIRAA